MKVVEVLRQLYTENEVKFALGSTSTGWMATDEGVHQGCVMSPTLFNCFLDELLTRIRKSGKGVGIGNQNWGALHMQTTWSS